MFEKEEVNMSREYCNRCGARLILTNLGYHYCPNCGIVPDNKPWDKEDDEKKMEAKYIG